MKKVVEGNLNIAVALGHRAVQQEDHVLRGNRETGGMCWA